MIGEVIEKAADLAATGAPTVERALIRFGQTKGPFTSREGQVWISVAFLISRHEALAATLPNGLPAKSMPSM